MAEETTNGVHCDALLEGNGKSSLSGSTEKKRRKSVTHIFSAKIKRKKDSAPIQEDFIPDLATIQNLVTTKGKEIIQRRYLGGRTALHIVAEKGDLKTIEYLHSVQAKLDAIDDCGWTALHWACYKGNMDIIMFLIAAGASCIVITEEGDSPLHLFISNAHPDHSLFSMIFYELVKLSKDIIHLANSRGDTCIHLAAQTGKQFIVDKLILYLPKGNFYNSKNIAGETPLHIAAKGGEYEIVRALIQANASPEIPDINGKKPSRFPEVNDHPKIKKLLQGSPLKPQKKGLRSSQQFQLPAASPRGVIIPIRNKKESLEVPVQLTHSDPSIRSSDKYRPSRKRPDSARVSTGSAIKVSLPRSSSEKMDKRNPKLSERTGSLPAADLGEQLRKLMKEEETISEESPLYEEAPTPRSQKQGSKPLVKSNSSPHHRNHSSTLVVQSTPTSSRQRSTSVSGREKGKKPASFLKLQEPEVIIENHPVRESVSIPPLQKQVTITSLREEETDEEDEYAIADLERQLMQSQALAKQLRIELNMTKDLLEKANRKLVEKDKLIAELQRGN